MPLEVCASVRAGKNLKRLIKSSEWKTQERFAREAIHVDPVTVRRWIAFGINNVNTIEEIANIFGISLKEILK